MAFECLVRYQHIRESEIAADGCYRWLERIGAGSRYCLGCRFLPHLRSVGATANRVQSNRFCGEAHLATALAAGQSLKSASRTLVMSLNTARSHLKAIFMKTATYRQVDLVRELVSSAIV